VVIAEGKNWELLQRPLIAWRLRLPQQLRSTFTANPLRHCPYFGSLEQSKILSATALLNVSFKPIVISSSPIQDECFFSFGNAVKVQPRIFRDGTFSLPISILLTRCFQPPILRGVSRLGSPPASRLAMCVKAIFLLNC